jgi:hypothetical protein
VPAGTLVLRERGGRAGGYQQWIFGSAEYRVGESVLVFLSRYPDGALRTTALALGKYHLEEKQDGTVRAVRRLGGDVAVLDPQTGFVRSGAADDDLPLGMLISRLHGALAGGAVPAVGRVLARPPELQRVTLESRPAFVLFSPAVRWFEPDAGTPIG